MSTWPDHQELSLINWSAWPAIKLPGLGMSLTNTIYRTPGSRVELLENVSRSYIVVKNAVVVAGSPREPRNGNAIIEFTTPIYVSTGCIRAGEESLNLRTRTSLRNVLV